MKLCMVGAWGHSIYTLESLGDLPEMELAGLYSGDANPPSYLLDEAKKLLTAHLTHDAKRRTPRLQPFAELVRCGHCNGAMTVRQTVKTKNRQYCYYICNEDTKRNVRICPTPRLPAEEFESLVLREIAKVLKKPTMLAEIDRRLGEDDNGRSIRQEVMMTLVAKLE